MNQAKSIINDRRKIEILLILNIYKQKQNFKI